jgi:hypothetical protein
MRTDSMLMLAGGDGAAGERLSSQPRVPYNADEQRLSVHVKREMDQLILGGRDHLVLLKLYPRAAEGSALGIARPELTQGAVRREIMERIAGDALNFFGPLHGGVVTQETLDDVIMQAQWFSTTYPHINLERYDFYDAPTGEPLLGTWRASRIQNLRRETRTNRMIDLALLALEVGKFVFPTLG